MRQKRCKDCAKNINLIRSTIRLRKVYEQRKSKGKCVRCGNKTLKRVYCRKCFKQFREFKSVREDLFPERHLIRYARYRAKKNKLAFNISIKDIHVPKKCPVLGIPIFRNTRKNKAAGDNSPSLDRTNPKLGYIRGNVDVISWRANSLKKNGTLEEFKKIIKYLKRKENE